MCFDDHELSGQNVNVYINNIILCYINKKRKATGIGERKREREREKRQLYRSENHRRLIAYQGVLSVLIFEHGRKKASSVDVENVGKKKKKKRKKIRS